MGQRLSRIYTRTGDGGDTGIGDGTRVNKADVRIKCLGDIDELNAHLGLLSTHTLASAVNMLIKQIQHQLFDLGAEICSPRRVILTKNHTIELEQQLDSYNAQLQPLEEFILPGGSASAAQCHVCRTVCRRAERSIVSLHENQQVSEMVLSYINRLSDLLFVIARILNKSEGIADVLWQPNLQR